MNILLGMHQMTTYYILMNIMFRKLCIYLFISVYWIAAMYILKKIIVCISKLISMNHLVIYHVLVSIIFYKLCIHLFRGVCWNVEKIFF